MAQHDVTFTIPERSLGRSDLEFRVKKDSEVVGRLRVSKGAIEWVPRNQTLGYRMTWAQFDKVFQTEGKPVR